MRGRLALKLLLHDLNDRLELLEAMLKLLEEDLTNERLERLRCAPAAHGQVCDDSPITRDPGAG